MQTCAAVYQAEGRDNDVFVCTVRALCDWTALEMSGSRAHQEIPTSFRIPGDGENFPFRNYPRRNCPLATSAPPVPLLVLLRLKQNQLQRTIWWPAKQKLLHTGCSVIDSHAPERDEAPWLPRAMLTLLHRVFTLIHNY